ncbi:hypothetical protein F4776DRAFT_671042 [Hypoxylon sp. NC0597]|nr:hypothetical protein F4776DRAFT_671042 [Hypoxylon sp. NC0597]
MYSHGTFKYIVPKPDLTPQTMSVSEVQQRRANVVPRIWNHFEKLRGIVERHESVIQRRWRKKSKVARRYVLQRAWGSSPPMATKHRPDVVHIRCRPFASVERSHFMWPYINLEDLEKTEPLLLLLNARGRNSPSTFAFTDLEHAMFGYRVGTLRGPPFLDRWNMRFTGRDSPNLSPGEGLWVLKIQDRLYQFLLKTCKEILHDLNLEDEELQTLPVQEEPPLPTSNRNDDALTTSLMITRYEATYHLPSKLDVRRIQSLISAKCSEVEDRLRALREDPGFFAYKILEMYQHRPEQLPDPNGRCQPLLRTEDQRKQLMAVVTMQVTTYSMADVEIWAFMHEKANRLAALKEKLFDGADKKIQPEEDLPPELAQELYSFIFHLDQLMNPFIARAERTAITSPTLRHLIRCDPEKVLEAAVNEDADVKFDRSNVKITEMESEYLWVLKNMSDKYYRGHMGVHTCVEELERIASDPKGRKLVTNYMAEYYSDICIMTECKRQTELFQPWAATFDAAMDQDEMRQRLLALGQRTIDTLTPLFDFRLKLDTTLAGSAIVKMKYPVDKRPSQSNVEAIQAAETALDSFWEKVIAEVREAGLWKGRIKEVLLRRPERKVAYVETPKSDKRSTSDITAVETFGGDSLRQDAKPQSTLVTAPKVKEKTRPPEKPVQEDAANDENAPDDGGNPPQSTFEVDKRAKKVFSMLFYDPSVSRSRLPGEIPWADFLYAMHHVGFSIEKLGGSRWQFTPGPTLEGDEYSRGIQFHEPHPNDKVPFIIARLHGRRLARAYGWDGEMFQEREGPN